MVEKMCVVLDNSKSRVLAYSGSLGTFLLLHAYAPFEFTGLIVKIEKE